MTPDWVRVVAGIVIENQKVLVSQRTATQSFPLKWEFPGGKIEPGETPAEALTREFREELGIGVLVKGIYDHIRYPGREGKSIDVLFLFARRIEGEPRTLEVEAVKWVPLATLDRVDFIPADRGIVGRLQKDEGGLN